MDGEQSILTTAELGKAMLARRLLADHAARRGYPGQANYAHWALHLQWLESPAPRPDFWTYVIQTLGERHV